MSEIDSFFEDFDSDLLDEVDVEFKELSDLFYNKFNDTIPLSLIPDRISIVELKTAVEECIVNNDRDILRRLNVEIYQDALY